MNRSPVVLSRSRLAVEAPSNISASGAFGSNRNPASMARFVRGGRNPNGIVSFSAGLRGTSYPGAAPPQIPKPNGVAVNSMVPVAAGYNLCSRASVIRSGLELFQRSRVGKLAIPQAGKPARQPRRLPLTFRFRFVPVKSGASWLQFPTALVGRKMVGGKCRALMFYLAALSARRFWWPGWDFGFSRPCAPRCRVAPSRDWLADDPGCNSSRGSRDAAWRSAQSVPPPSQCSAVPADRWSR